jgi:hypothetical protein
MNNDINIELFEKYLDGKYKYKLDQTKDDAINIYFQVDKSTEWDEVIKDCQFFWYRYNYICHFDEDFHNVKVIKSNTIFKTVVEINGPLISDKKRYIKTLLILLLSCAILSLLGGYFLNIYSTWGLDLESTIMLSLNILIVLFAAAASISTLLFLNKRVRWSLVMMVLNSSLLDIIFIVLIQHFNTPILYQESNIANTIINFLVLLISTLLVSILLAVSSHQIRKFFQSENNNIYKYFYFRNMTLDTKKVELVSYIKSNKLNMSEIILSSDATSDFIGHLDLKLNFTNEGFTAPLFNIFLVFVLIFYFGSILAPLSIWSRVFLIVFILFRTTLITINGVKKDKLILINAIYHLEKILNG